MPALKKMRDYIVSTMDNKNIKIGLVIMASGLGKRFGGGKLTAELLNKPLIRWIIDTTEGLFDRRIVVTRDDRIKSLCEELNIECIYHDLPYRSDTIRLGLDSIKNDIDYCFFTPADQPLIKRSSIIKLIDEAKKNSNMIVRPGFDKVVGAPVGFPIIHFNELLGLTEGQGGNNIANKYPDSVRVIKVEDEYELWDIDTVSDFEKISDMLKKDSQ